MDIPPVRLILLLSIAILLTACGSTREERLAHFATLEAETKAALIKEHPGAEAELADSVGYAVFEQDILKIPVVGWASGSGVIVEKAGDKRTYVKVPEIQFGAGWGARAQKVVVIFQDVDKLRDLADGDWRAGIKAEAAAKAGDTGAAGGGGTGDLEKQGYSLYVMTEAGISATATFNIMRIKPYSLD